MRGCFCSPCRLLRSRCVCENKFFAVRKCIGITCEALHKDTGYLCASRQPTQRFQTLPDTQSHWYTLDARTNSLNTLRKSAYVWRKCELKSMVVTDAPPLFKWCSSYHSEDLSASIHLNASYSSANEFSHAGGMIFRQSVSCNGDISSS